VSRPLYIYQMKTIKDFDLANKKVLVRCDFNVPIDDAGNILDDFRIKKTLPTIQYLMQHKAKVVLMSHLDPEETGFVEPQFNLGEVAKRLSELLNVTVVKTDDCLGEKTQQMVGALKSGQVLLLENLRFHMGEKQNTDVFAKNLAGLAQIYINDAFSVCHRAHASVVGIPKYLPSGVGLLVEEEIKKLDKILKNPKHPLIAIVGGDKVGTKVAFINNISRLADFVLIGGLLKKESIAEHISFENPDKIIGPEDNLDAPDIDQKTVDLFVEKILAAETVVWNGPFGKFEDEKYKEGTLAISKAIIESKAFSVVGGGQTVEFLNKEGMIDKFSHVSTGGGAMLDYLSGEKLPGLEVLK